MQMAMSMRVNGKMIRPMDRVLTHIQMEPSIRELGKKINSMASEKRLGQMELAMKGTM